MTEIYDLPTSTDPHPAWDGTALTPRAICVRAPNVNIYTVMGTNSWIVAEPGASACLIVDPGPNDPEHFDAILNVCAERHLTVAAIVLTHKHFDHVDGVPAFLERIGTVPVYGRAPEDDLEISESAGTLPDYRPLRDGAFAPFANCPDMEIISLPGHSSDLIGLVLCADKAVCTGDMIFRDWSTLIEYPDGRLEDYFQSLHLLEQMTAEGKIALLLPGHGHPIDDPASTVSSYLAHREKRLEGVREAVRKTGSAEVEVICQEIYGDQDPSLLEGCLESTEAQLAYLKYLDDPCLRDLRTS